MLGTRPKRTFTSFSHPDFNWIANSVSCVASYIARAIGIKSESIIKRLKSTSCLSFNDFILEFSICTSNYVNKSTGISYGWQNVSHNYKLQASITIFQLTHDKI